jgi:outer membrane protein TolC
MINAPLANGSIEGSDTALTSQANVPAIWWKMYDDPVLNSLVDEALQSNTNLRVAAANLARSREALGIAQAQGGFSGKASAAVERAQESAEQYLLFEKLPVANEGDFGISISYEFDLFGKLRRGSGAGRYRVRAGRWRSRADQRGRGRGARLRRTMLGRRGTQDRATVARIAEAARGRVAPSA